MWHDIEAYSKVSSQHSFSYFSTHLEKNRLTTKIVIWYVLRTDIALELCIQIRNWI